MACDSVRASGDDSVFELRDTGLAEPHAGQQATGQTHLELFSGLSTACHGPPGYV